MNLDPTTTTVALVDDTTDENLEYRDYRGWVGLNTNGEWVENLTDEQIQGLDIEWDTANVEYTKLGKVNR